MLSIKAETQFLKKLIHNFDQKAKGKLNRGIKPVLHMGEFFKKLARNASIKFQSCLKVLWNFIILHEDFPHENFPTKKLIS